MIEITSRYRGSNLLVFPIIVYVQKYVGDALPMCIKMHDIPKHIVYPDRS